MKIPTAIVSNMSTKGMTSEVLFLYEGADQNIMVNFLSKLQYY